MSILIKGMEMPTRCAVCVLCDLRYGTKCKITKMSYYDSEGYPRGGYNGRPDWCPIVEVPAPHGDLIDIDSKITIAIKDGLKVTTVRDLLNDKAVRLPKTVIEAERRTDG